jgi:hypothetical protein
VCVFVSFDIWPPHWGEELDESAGTNSNFICRNFLSKKFEE